MRPGQVALGAQQIGVVGLVLRRAALAAGIGVAAGLTGAFLLRKFMATQLVLVSAVDSKVLAAVAAFLLAVAVVSAWAPARWASRIDPAVALRSE